MFFSFYGRAEGACLFPAGRPPGAHHDHEKFGLAGWLSVFFLPLGLMSDSKRPTMRQLFF